MSSTKRKRSTGSLFTASAVETPSSPTPFFSSPVLLPNFFAHSKGYDPQTSSPIAWKQSNHPHQAQQEDEDTTSQAALHSRTRKRYRDGRPEESQIHASTVEKLFSAQKAHPHASPLPSHPQNLQHQHLLLPQDAPAQRSTLHSFWHLPQTSQLSTQHSTPLQAPQQEILTCEGCDGVLIPEYGMDTLEAETACRACGKCVCNTCAITADVRLCLDCAMQG